MVLRYERTLAPSEEVADIAAGSIGFDIEEVIWAHYLTETQADRLPGGSDVPPDWRDTGVVTDYIKMLFERHRNEQPKLSEQALKDDSRVKGRLRVPDISTYRGRFVPPRILQTPHGPIEDRGRCEYYEIKPNSETGEDDGRAKLHDIADSYKRHSLSQISYR
jgi:hypothetical protein